MPHRSTEPTNKAKTKPRKFYIISYSLMHGLADFEVENIDVLRMGARALYPPQGARGFPVSPERPRVVLGKRRKGPPPSDIELFHSYWLVSDRLKTVFETFDPGAAAFQPCDVTLRDGAPGPTFWLCDIVRILEPFGEGIVKEIEEYRKRTGWQYTGFHDREDVEFNEHVVGASHLFRTPYSADVFCDQNLKDACKAAGLKGVAFSECPVRRRRTARPLPQPEPRSKPLRELRDQLLARGDAVKTVSLAIAARSALRAIPLLEHLFWDAPLPKRMRPSVGRPRMSNGDIVLGCFRSAATAWVAALSPEFGASERFHAIKHEARMAGGSEDAGKSPASAVGAATHSAMMTAIWLFEKPYAAVARDPSRQGEISALLASQTTASAAVGFLAAYDPQAEARLTGAGDIEKIFNSEPSPTERVVWDAASDDVRHWGEVKDMRTLLAQPLWLAGVPPHADDDWRKLAARLRGRTDERWVVWIDWYEARLSGSGEISERDEIARVSLADAAWKQGAAAVNASITG